MELCILRSPNAKFSYARGCPWQCPKIIFFIHLDQQKGLKFCIFSSPIIEFSYARGVLPPCNPQIIYTYKFKLLKGHETMHFTSPNTNFLTQGGTALDPWLGLFPWTPPGTLWIHTTKTLPIYFLYKITAHLSPFSWL